jgi:hypothetical protein
VVLFKLADGSGIGRPSLASLISSFKLPEGCLPSESLAAGDSPGDGPGVRSASDRVLRTLSLRPYERRAL